MELFKLMGTIAVDNSKANEAIDDTTDKGEEAESKLSKSFKKIAGAVAAAFAVEKIVSFGKEIVNMSAEVSAEQSAFEQIMGDYSDNAQKKINEIANATGMVSTRLTPYMTSMTAKFKGLGYDIDDATDLASDGLNLAADAAAFWDKSLDDSMGALNSFINGSYEGGEAIGLFANDTQLASYAVKNGIVSETKEWANLDEAKKQATRLEYAKAMFDQSGATGQAAKEAGQYANVQANLTEKWRQFKAQLGEPILQNIVLPAMDKLSKLVDIAAEKFQDLKKWVADNKDTFDKLGKAAKSVVDKFKEFISWLNSGSASAEAFKAIIVGITAAFVAYKTATLAMTVATKAQTLATNLAATAQKALNLVMNANPISILVLAIVGLVAAFVYLWNNCESFRKFWINLWNEIKKKVTTIFNAIKHTIQTVVNAIKSFVQKAFSTIKEKIINPIKNAYSKVKETFTNIKNAISDRITAAKTKVSDVFNGIKNSIKEKVEWARDKVKSAVDKIKGFFDFSGLKTKVKNLFDDVKEKITSPIDKAKELVDSAISKIKKLFPLKLGKIFDGIKLPHFNISGGKAPWGIGGKGKKPSIGIDWYAKAMNNPMLLNKPTIFGLNNDGQLMGAGEAGSEVVSGTNTLLGMIESAVSTQTNKTTQKLEVLISMLAEYMPQVIDNANKQIVLDTGVLAGQLAPGMDSRLGDINRLRERGR